MNDIELLEMAAKASGIAGNFLDNDEFFLNGARTPDNDTTWNPLDRDGDAFRLALKCDIAHGRQANSIWARWEFNSRVFWENGERDGIQDLAAAARRAIVRTAADIGKNMP